MDRSNNILLINPAFDPASAPQCNLLVNIGFDSFSYAIINKETGSVSAVYDEQECSTSLNKWAERIQTDHYLQLPYREIKIAIYTENKIDIPNDFFHLDELAIYAQYFTMPHSGDLYASRNDHFGFTTIFALSKTAENLLKQFRGKKYHASAGLLALAKNSNESNLMLDFTVGSVGVIYLQNDKIIFQKSYEIENSEEFNYYLLLLLTQLEVDLKNTQVLLSGIVHQDDAYYNCLTKYFKKIDFSICDKLDQEVLTDMPAHYYSNLLALDQCE